MTTLIPYTADKRIDIVQMIAAFAEEDLDIIPQNIDAIRLYHFLGYDTLERP